MDSNTANTPIVSKELTARRSSASAFLTALRYSRPSTPASSGDRHVRIAAYETAGRAERSASEQQQQQHCIAARVSQVCLRPSSLFPHTHRPPACKRALSRNLPPASASKGAGWAGWLTEGGEEEERGKRERAATGARGTVPRAPQPSILPLTTTVAIHQILSLLPPPLPQTIPL